MKPMNKKVVSWYKTMVIDRDDMPWGIRDLYYFVADLDKRPLLFVNAWGDNLDINVDDPYNHTHESTCTTIPHGSTSMDIREMALEEASNCFDLDRDKICLISMRGRVLCR